MKHKVSVPWVRRILIILLCIPILASCSPRVSDPLPTRIAHGMALMEDEDFKQALDVFLEAYPSFPDHVDLLHHIAQCYHHLGRPTDAQHFIQLCLDENPSHIPALLELSQYALEAKDFLEASLKAEKALRIDPTNILIYKQLAKISLAQQYDDAAMDYYKQALAYSPHDRGLHFAMATHYHKKGDYEKTLQHCQHILDNTHPGDLPAQLLSIESTWLLQNHQKALSTLDTFLHQHPDHVELLLLKSRILLSQQASQESQALINRVLILAPESLPALSQQAQIFLHDKKTYDAIQTLETIKSLQPHSHIAYRIAVLHSQHANFSDAIASLEEALSLQPDLSMASLLLIKIYVKMGWHDAAFLVSSDAIAQSPQHPELLKEHGILLASLQRYHNAMDIFSENTEDNSGDPFVKAYHALARSHSDQALEIAEQHRQKTGTHDVSVMNVIALALIQLKYYDKALQIFADMTETHPKQTIGRINAASLFQKQSEHTKSMDTLNDVLAINPHSSIAKLRLAQLAMDQGHFERARILYHDSLEDNPHDPETYYQLATLYHHQNEHTRVQNHLKQCLALYPQHRFARHDLIQSYLRSRNFSSMEKELQNILDRNPSHIPSMTHMALIALYQGNTNIAHTYFQELLDLSQHQVPLYHQTLAWISFLMNNYSTGQKQILPDDLDNISDTNTAFLVQIMAINTFILQHDIDRALHLLDTWPLEYIPFKRHYTHTMDVLRTRSSQAQEILTSMNYAIVYLQYQWQDIGLEILQKLYRRTQDPLVGQFLGTVLMHAQQWAEAKKVFQHMLSKTPHDDLYWMLGDLALQEGLIDDAVPYYKKSLAMNAQQPRLWIKTGELLFTQGHHDKALETSRKALDLFPDNPTFYYYHARYLYEQHEIAQAKSALDKAMTLLQHFPEYDQAKELFHQINEDLTLEADDISDTKSL